MLAPSLRAEFVYVTSYNSSNVSAYSIGANGALTPVPGSPFDLGGTFPVSMSVDPVDRFIYVANEGGTENLNGTVNFNGTVLAYRVAENGALTSVAGSPFPAGSFSISVAVDFLGRFVYVANKSDNNVSAYKIDADGALTPVAGSPFPVGNILGSSLTSLAVDFLVRYVYAANYTTANVSVFRIGENGALRPVSGSPFPAGTAPYTIALDRWRRFVYVANFASSNVSAYRIGENGVLTPVAGSPFPAENNPRPWRWTSRAGSST